MSSYVLSSCMCSDLGESVFCIDNEKTGLPASACEVIWVQGSCQPFATRLDDELPSPTTTSFFLRSGLRRGADIDNRLGISSKDPESRAHAVYYDKSHADALNIKRSCYREDGFQWVSNKLHVKHIYNEVRVHERKASLV